MEIGNEIYHVIGVMAGSSMDGLDVALIEFKKAASEWTFKLNHSETFEYTTEIHSLLKSSSAQSNKRLVEIDLIFGQWVGQTVNNFIKHNDLNADLLAVHGHTVIHQPENGISWQLGSGHVIAQLTGRTTITDFRSLDVKLGGQGAPLVPFGDFELFKSYDACLNLGGIANISLKQERIAWDICPCNQALNHYANKLGQKYDSEGMMSREGALKEEFILHLKEIAFFSQMPPKSLPNNFIDDRLLDSISPLNGLRSYSEFIAKQIEFELSPYDSKEKKKLLVTGGGAHNHFLMELIQQKLKNWEVIVPSQEIIEFKEALIFGFLGLKCVLGEINVLASVTGGSKDTCSGVIHLPK